MSVAIVLVFAVCFLPFSIYALLSLYSSNMAMTSSCGMRYFVTIALLLTHSYCAVNPCICFIFSGNYRQGLKKSLRLFSYRRSCLVIVSSPAFCMLFRFIRALMWLNMPAVSLSLFIENYSREIFETRAATGERIKLNLARFDTNSSTVRNKNF